MLLTDAQIEAFKATINNTIHELVFASHFLEEDDLEGAQNALMTVAGNVERVSNEVSDLAAS